MFTPFADALRPPRLAPGTSAGPPASGCGLGAGPGRGQAGVLGAGADLAELIADPHRRPGRFGRVGVAQVQQRPVRHAADIRSADGAEGG